MGFFKRLFSKKKLTLEEAGQLNEVLHASLPQPPTNEQTMLRNAVRILSARKFHEAIAAYQQLADTFPESKGTYLSQIGGCYYFLGEYDRAIEYYVIGRDNGAPAVIMDHNIWEACETIYNKTKDLAAIDRYFELCPNGQNMKAAMKLRNS